MAKITYIVTNPGATVCALGRDVIEFPGGCRNLEITVPDTPEMKRTMNRVRARHPQIIIAEKKAGETVQKPAIRTEEKASDKGKAGDKTAPKTATR